MIHRISEIDQNVFMTVIYGEKSWIKQFTLDELTKARQIQENIGVMVKSCNNIQSISK